VKGRQQDANGYVEPAGMRQARNEFTGIAVALGAAVAVLTSDVILGVIAGAGFFAVTIMMVRLWTGRLGPPVEHH
jgi:hypothetical protein